MSVGRNEPGPCRSGKKYKKCCMPKDENASRERAAAEEPKTGPPIPFPRKDEEDVPVQRLQQEPAMGTTTPDPRDERRDALFLEFEAAEYEQRIALFLQTLDDPYLMDAELAFDTLEMLYRDSVERGDRDCFDDLTAKLRERRPDVYAEEEAIILNWRITNALVAARSEDVSILAYQMARLAGNDIDLFIRAEDGLAYHGYLATLVEVMRLAWPEVRVSSNVLPWAIEEFSTRAVAYEILNHAAGASGPGAPDPELKERLELYSFTDTAAVDSVLEQITQWPGKLWITQDFRSRESAGTNLLLLTMQFLEYLRRFEGVPYAKGELARRDLQALIMDHNRHANRRQRGRTTPVRKSSARDSFLLPNSKRLDRYLADLLSDMVPAVHRAAALFEIMPPWLRFLESRRLIESGIREQAIADLTPLADQLI